MELKGKAETLVPIKLRTQVHKDSRPIRCLHDYKNAQVSITGPRTGICCGR